MAVIAKSNSSTVLQDVNAYVDVWLSDRRANCSPSLIQQLLQMGAQVSKRFNKRVTHVVFHNGHPATWKRAKTSKVKLVSVVWVWRCYDDGVLVDEELYPALNDESSPFFNRKHRCMLPKDIPERTPKNDRRMKKKFDELMKAMAPKQTFVRDDSPFFIDEDGNVAYSSPFKVSEYMAERLKQMKEENENISPTASQMSSSGEKPSNFSPSQTSASGEKPSLGNSPTVFSFFDENTDEDSSATITELCQPPAKEKNLEESDAPEHKKLDKLLCKDFDKPWLSPCRDVSTRVSISPLKCPDFQINEEESQTPEKQRLASVTTLLLERPESVMAAQNLFEEVSANDCKDASKIKLTPQTKPCSSLDKTLEQPNGKSGKRRPNVKRAEMKSTNYTTNNNGNCLDALSSPCPVLGDKLLLRKNQMRGSLCMPQRSFSSPYESLNVASSSPAGKDNVFDDYFASANHKKLKRPLSPVLSDLTDLDIPSEFNDIPKKKRRSESTKSFNKRNAENRGRSFSLQSIANICPGKDIEEGLPALDHPNGTRRLDAKSRKQSALPIVGSSEGKSKHKKPSPSARPATLTKKTTTSDVENNTSVYQLSHLFQSRGSKSTNKAASTKILDEDQGKPNQHTNAIFQKIGKEKSMRTLVMTSMPSEKQNTVVQVVKALGGFSIADQVCESTTHIVSGEHRRTLNILLGIARGCWILSFEWILWCLEQRQWIPEEPFELSEQFPAAQISRLQRHLSSGDHHQQDLFKDQPPMFVSQNSQPPAPILIELILLCGGTVCKTARQARIYIGKYIGRRPLGSRILSEQWVLDSITSLKQLSFDNYDLA
ncbi:microcephalin [Corythoichthys intestinalis]|uniref:microcephalin n=1 Tax=Corythoichthys intestinalis TaxID=161448 RepID=UPI0025A5A075|nr:microcephalin [Corythoichthys intestinalis]XP_057704741.1 microcephalin [Corythoichthys intestinalis]XP_057704742.1 microcephalin [Corythoichthys intestinalis]